MQDNILKFPFRNKNITFTLFQFDVNKRFQLKMNLERNRKTYYGNVVVKKFPGSKSLCSNIQPYIDIDTYVTVRRFQRIDRIHKMQDILSLIMECLQIFRYFLNGLDRNKYCQTVLANIDRERENVPCLSQVLFVLCLLFRSAFHG